MADLTPSGPPETLHPAAGVDHGKVSALPVSNGSLGGTNGPEAATNTAGAIGSDLQGTQKNRPTRRRRTGSFLPRGGGPGNKPCVRVGCGEKEVGGQAWKAGGADIAQGCVVVC